MPEPESPKRRSWTEPLLPKRLANAPAWQAAAAFGCGVLALSLLARLGMAALAVREHYLSGLGPAAVLWVGPTLGHDLLGALLVALPVFLALRFLPASARIARGGALALGYTLLLFTSLLCLVSVGTYGALHSTLHWTQILLAGGARDIFESGMDIVSKPGLAAGVLIVLGSLAVVPLFLAPLARLHAALREKRALLAALAALVLLGVGGVFAPKSGAAGLEVNPLLEFAISGVRYGLRQRDTSTIDMSGAPHFDQSLIRGKPAPVEPLEQLLATDKLPLRNANVILLVLESASVNQLPLWRGKTPGLTPRLTELSQHALMFDDYYTAAPVSMKSLFTLHCSSYPYPHPAAETYANPNLDCMSISEVLKKRGYRTALLHSGRFSYTHKDDFFRPRRYDVMRDADMLVHRDKYPLVLWGADDRAAVDDALEWLDQAPDKPFFLDLIFLAPHHPYTIREAPMPYGDKNDLSRYKNATQLIDSQIGRIWDWLVAHGKADNTLLVVVGDHGEAFGEHPGHFTHGTRIYEEAARTPMMLINPQLFKGVHTQRVGNHVDLVPTILDTLGIPAVARHQGHSLLRGFKPHILYFYADWYRHYLGLRDGQWKYIYDEDADQPELYDLTRDFAEKTNVAAQHADQVKLYRDRVLKWEGFYRELIPSYEHYVNSDAKCRNKPVCYLDDLRPVLQHGDMRKNRSWGGDYLRVGKRKGQRGLGVTPLSILRYNIRSEGYRKLIGAVGHHVQGRNANLSLKVSAEIYLDDKLIWSSGKLAADEEPHDFALDVTGGSVLELIGYDVDGENWRDYMDWLDVRLER